MSTRRETIIQKALEILKNNPDGVRYTDLVKRIKNELPDLNENTICGTVYNLQKQRPFEVEKPKRGLFRFILNKEENAQNEGVEVDLKDETKIGKKGPPLEKILYHKFADFLKNDLEECTKAIPLCGRKFQDKWDSPCVLGVYNYTNADPIRPTPEIISAEIKSDTNQLITAFGQACAYKLFSHKVYLVIPQDSEDADKSRIESLCSRFGIGLITFNKKDKSNPNFQIRTRAIKSEPDYFYVNEYLRRLNKDDLK